jgi:ferric iron reductase protein FhuF
VVPDEAALLARLRRTLLDEHVGPLLDAVLGSVRISRRLLLGSVASGIVHATRHATTAVGAPAAASRAELLTALGLADLVDASGEGPVYRRTCCLLFTLPGTRFCGDCSYRRP